MMSYIKLIAIKIGDFFSTIEFEQNYSVTDKNRYESTKSDLEKQGYYCILANVDSNMEI